MGHKPKERVLPEGTRNVAGINIPIQQGLGTIPVIKERTAVPTANSTAAVAEQIALAKDIQAKAMAIPGYANALQDSGLNNGTRVNVNKAAKGITTKSDKTYIDSLKIDSVERYNELLARKAFHSGNPEVMEIAKNLGINKDGSVTKPKALSTVTKTKKKPENVKASIKNEVADSPVTNAEVFVKIPDSDMPYKTGYIGGTDQQMPPAQQPSIEEIINSMGANKYTTNVVPYLNNLTMSAREPNYQLNQ